MPTTRTASIYCDVSRISWRVSARSSRSRRGARRARIRTSSLFYRKAFLMSDAVREAGHELANQLSTVLALADLERRRAERSGGDTETFVTIADCVRKAAVTADVLSAASRDLRYLRK